MAQKPLSEMADTGYENMSEEAGYVLHELKSFATAASNIIEAKADRSELSSIWRAAETNFAAKPDFTSLAQFVSTLTDKTDKIPDLQAAVNYLATHNDHSKCYVVDVTITSGELLALNATPKVLVAAPSASQYIEVKRLEFFLDFETTAYTSLQDLSLEYATSGQLQLIPSAGWLDGTSDKRRCAHHSDILIVGVGEAVTLKMLVGEILTGDSPLKVRVDYRIVDVLV